MSSAVSAPLPLPAEFPPLHADASGVVHVGNSRITLDLVVEQYENGMAPEDIVRAYDTLTLADVHGAIAYYLRHRYDVQSYMKRREEQARSLKAMVEARQASPSREELERKLSGGT